MLKGVTTALKALFIVLLGHYHTISDRYTLTPIPSNAKRSSINRLLHFCDVKLDV